jgi:hypothetical protein
MGESLTRNKKCANNEYKKAESPTHVNIKVRMDCNVSVFELAPFNNIQTCQNIQVLRDVTPRRLVNTCGMFDGNVARVGCLTLKGELGLSETSATFTSRQGVNILDDLNLQQHRCENLKPRYKRLRTVHSGTDFKPSTIMK